MRKRDKRPVIAIDCDEVIRALVPTMVELYNKAFNKNLVFDDVKDFDVSVSFPAIKETTGYEASDWFFRVHSKELFVDSQAFPMVSEDIKRLQKYARVVVLTHQKSYDNKMQTLQWLFDHDINPDGICFLKDKSLLHCSYFIDDNDWNFTDCRAHTGILIDAPYNKNVDLEELKSKGQCVRLKRMKSLHEFTDWFCEKVEEMLNELKI